MKYKSSNWITKTLIICIFACIFGYMLIRYALPYAFNLATGGAVGVAEPL